MKNLGAITDPKDIITKEFLEEGIGTKVNTLEDNLQMAESDIEALQGDVQSLQTDNTATKAAVKTLQDTYVPNTRKVNGKALDADITLTASDVGALGTDYNPIWIVSCDYDGSTNLTNISKTYTEILNAYNSKYHVLMSINVAQTVDKIGGETLLAPLTNVSDSTAIFSTVLGTTDSVYQFAIPSSSEWQAGAKRQVYLQRDGSGDYDWSAEYHRIQNLGTPEDYYDATTKNYVDSLSTTVINDTSVATTAWVTNTNPQASTQEKTDFPFMATISLADVTTDYCVDVLFSYDDQISGNFCPCVYSVAGGIIVEAKEKPSATVTIPVIRYWKPTS